jgi:hypothetical protein
VLDFNEVEVGSKYCSEVTDEVASGLRKVGKWFIVGFIRSVRVRRPNMETRWIGAGDSIKVVGVRGAINGAESKERLNITKVDYIVNSGHARKGVGEGGIMDVITD